MSEYAVVGTVNIHAKSNKDNTLKYLTLFGRRSRADMEAAILFLTQSRNLSRLLELSGARFAA